MTDHNENSGNLWKLQYIRNKRQTAYEAFQKARKDILLRKKMIEDKIESYAEDLFIQLNADWMRVNESLTQQEKTLQKSENLSKDYVTILPVKRLSDFYNGTFTDETIHCMFGDLKSVTCEELDLSIINSFHTELSYVNPFCIVNDQVAFVSCAIDKTVLKINLDKNADVIEKYDNLQSCSLFAFKSGEILFSNATDTSLKLIDQTGTIKIFHDFNSLVPKAVFVTENNELLVGLREITKRPFVMERNSTRQVWLIDSFGRTRQIFEFDDKDCRLFTIPSRITADNNNIFVLDTKDENCGRIVTLDFMGKLKWIYNGHTYAQNPFCPNDVTLSPVGLLIIPDTYNNALHFLNANGEVYVYTTISNLGITLPCSVSVDFRGRLYIGTGKDKTKKAMIHVVDIGIN